MLERLDRYWPLIVLLVVIACAGIGCGASAKEVDLPPLVSVQGTVLVDGTPEAGVSITLIPQGSTAGQVAYAVTDSMGAFSCQYGAGGEGCPEGTYAVTCSKLVTPEGNPIPEGASAADVMATDMLPMVYRDPVNPFQTIQVTSAGVTGLTLELKTSSR